MSPAFDHCSDEYKLTQEMQFGQNMFYSSLWHLPFCLAHQDDEQCQQQVAKGVHSRKFTEENWLLTSVLLVCSTLQRIVRK